MEHLLQDKLEELKGKNTKLEGRLTEFNELKDVHTGLRVELDAKNQQISKYKKLVRRLN